MGKRRLVWLFAPPAIILGWVVYFSIPAPEPVYQGKRLSYWLEALGETGDPYGTTGSLSTPESELACNVITNIGPEAIPALLRMMRKQDTPLKVKLLALAQKQHWIKIEHTGSDELHFRARYAFGLLGPRAAIAVPELIKISVHTEDPKFDEVFGDIGPEARAAVPALLRGLASTNAEVRNSCQWSLEQITNTSSK